MFEKTCKWSFGEKRRHPVTTRKASFKTLYVNQVCALREQTRFQNSAVGYIKNQRAELDVLAPAPALSPQVNPTAGHAKKIFCAMPNGGNEI